MCSIVFTQSFYIIVITFVNIRNVEEYGIVLFVRLILSVASLNMNLKKKLFFKPVG